MNKAKRLNDDFYKSLFTMVLPMTLQNFMFSLVPISDMIMLVALDQTSMSAVSMAGQAMFVLNLFIYAVTAGCSMFAAQYWGKGDTGSIEKLFGYSMLLMVPIAVTFFGCAFFCPEGVMLVFTDAPGVVEKGISYLRIVSFAYIFDGIAQIIVVVLKNTGLVKQCTAISAAMVFMNIGLNAVFIYGLLGAPAMGCAGAALATTLSCFAGLAASVFILISKGSVRFRIRDMFRPDGDIRKEFSRYSTPMIANQLLWGIGFTMVSVIIGHLNDDAIAANAIAAVLKDLVSCLCFAIAAGGSIMVGNELGAGRLERGKEYGNRLTKLSIVSGLALGILTAALSPLIVNALNLTEQASYYLQGMLLMCSYYIMGRSINSTVIGGIFVSGGDTKFGMICDTITMWLFVVPLGALAAFVFNLPVMWVVFILHLDEMIKLPAVYIHYKKYRWVKNLVG